MIQKVFITGASSGIGLAGVRRFAAADWRVTAAVRSQARATELVGILEAEGITVDTLVFDQRDRAATDAALASLVADGVPDVLVNNASAGTFGPVELTRDEQIDMAFETNFVAPLRIIRALAPHMRERGSGVIINISSGLGFTGEVGQGLYAATKHAIEGLSESLSLEMRDFGVRVAVIEPGATKTDFNGKLMASEGYGPASPYWNVIQPRMERYAATIWKNGIGDAATVAEAIVDAATDPETPLFVPVGQDTVFSARLRGRDHAVTYGERLDKALDEIL